MNDPQAEAKAKRMRILKFIIKLVVSALALFFVFRKVDFAASLDAILGTNLWWFGAAAIWFNLTKIASVLRLQYFVRPLGVKLPFGWNVKLYFIGAFYNLFLPGSIGGDGYKVYLLKQRFDEKTTRKFLSAVFLDRVSGMAALFVITCILVLISGYEAPWAWFKPVVIAGGILCYPIYFLFIWKLFPDFRSEFWSTSLVSIFTQLGMVLFAWLIIHSLGITDHIYLYIVTFMVASVISIFPITLGGLGAREAVFLIAAGFTPLNPQQGVGVSILVFTVLSFSSFIGMFLNFTKDKNHDLPTEN